MGFGARCMVASKLDLLRMENGILSAQQSALQAHLRMDEPPAAGQT
jgi:hypothetical protein